MKIDLSLNRSLEEMCSSWAEFKDSDEMKTEEEEKEFGALEDCLDGSFGFRQINKVNVQREYIMKKDNIEEHDWNPEFPAEKIHIDFLKEILEEKNEIIARLEKEISELRK